MDAPSVATNQDLLPVILMRDELLDAEQVRAVREVQSHLRAEGRPMPFGAVVLEGELVDEETLARALQLQRKLAAPPGEPKRLGTYLLELGALRPHKLLEVLEAQAAMGHWALQSGNLREAEKYLRKAQKLDPANRRTELLEQSLAQRPVLNRG